MRRRAAIVSGSGAAIGALAFAGVRAAVHESGTADAVPADLLGRDRGASPAASRVYRMLTDLENAARAGHRTATVIGQHVELHNELYNADYGDYRGPKPPGYYYRKAADITGKLPGFLEVDLGPGYQRAGWGVGHARTYSVATWPSGQDQWAYVDDAVDLAAGVWRGLPRAADGTYNTDGGQPRADGAKSQLPRNGGAPAGIVGMSFHQPYPGSRVKGYLETLHRNAPCATDPKWIKRVLTAGTAEHQALLLDLSFLADHLSYLADHDVPVLLRPYHEMNVAKAGHGFWWSGLGPELYKMLWHTLYSYLVGSRGLHNLIFVWSPAAWDGAHGSEPWDYYPGSQYVDVVGVDDYSGPPGRPHGGGTWTGRWYDGLADYRKPRVMAESPYVPVNRAQPRTLSDTPWVIWTVWGQSLTQHNVSAPQGGNTIADVRATYDSPRVRTGGRSAEAGGWSWKSLRPT
jgi:mannan endo-1,4-beta-mannosidase